MANEKWSQQPTTGSTNQTTMLCAIDGYPTNPANKLISTKLFSLSGHTHTQLSGEVTVDKLLVTGYTGLNSTDVSGKLYILGDGNSLGDSVDRVPTAYINNLVIGIDGLSGYIPSGTTDPIGEPGQFSYDDTAIYIKTANGWYKSSLTSF